MVFSVKEYFLEIAPFFTYFAIYLRRWYIKIVGSIWRMKSTYDFTDNFGLRN